ncbi:DUF3854 domain-containing protein [Roseofilum reptotaenium CS-1145]|uniref:SF3 helicase domain-containing protein n=1 Tax=Roseofilum reptotaenium AO1-A TaxID=1925591 RepID=A0A1L9QCI0_9CYAN|nr:DUF3854 domain-containing protein [Roseofilum reptotaenium]MDB9519817.1 DUF3854 domain-containing protein [Roseofilum reptotaenium CS-1145]OJJ11411.1 hypothetical protein BI308_25725 [Roseofilum reptotaenium AO1-A]
MHKNLKERNPSLNSSSCGGHSRSPIVSDNDWLEQQLNDSGIKNPLLKKQFEVCLEGFTIQGISIDGVKLNPDSWQKRNRYPEKHLDKDGKPIKYITQKKKPGEEHGCYDAFLPAGCVAWYSELKWRCSDFLSGTSGEKMDITLSLGQFLVKHPSFPIIITEGAKKACCALENGYIAISIPGCSMWHKSQSTELVPILDALCVKGRPVYVALDSDFREKPEVKQQLQQLSKALEKRGCDVKICVWEPKGKEKEGMDDFIVGGGDFDEVIKAALTIAQWEKQFYNDCTQVVQDKKLRNKAGDKEERFTPFSLATQVAEIKEPTWRFDNAFKVWRQWDGKHWKTLEPEKVTDYLIEVGGGQIPSHSFVEQAEKLLRAKLRKLNKQDEDYPVFGKNHEYTYFRNGALRLEDRQFLPHQRENLNTHYIDRDYAPLPEDLGECVANLERYCPLVYEFLSYASNGDDAQLKKYLYCLAGVLLARYNWCQRFPLIHGKPGTGKGTFTRMMIALLGQENVATTSLSDIGGKFERARWLGKKMCLNPDERTWVKDISLLLKMTGHDDIPFDRKHKDPGESKFWGTLVIVFNSFCFSSDEALNRRADLILFPHPFKKRSRAKEIAMMREMGRLASVLFSIPTELVDAGISGDMDTPSLAIQKWELQCENNSVAAFLDEKLVPVPGHELLQSEAFRAYQDYCYANGLSKPVSNRRFGKELEVATTQVGLTLERKDCNRGKMLIGVALRKNTENADAPTTTQRLKSQAEESLENCAKTSPLSPLTPPQPNQDNGSNPHTYHHNITTGGENITTEEAASDEPVSESGASVVKTSPPVVEEVAKKEDETTVYQESGDSGDDSGLFLQQENASNVSPPDLRLGMRVKNKSLDMELFNEGVLTLPPGEDGKWGVFWEHFAYSSREHPDNLIPIVD